MKLKAKFTEKDLKLDTLSKIEGKVLDELYEKYLYALNEMLSEFDENDKIHFTTLIGLKTKNWYINNILLFKEIWYNDGDDIGFKFELGD